MRKSSKLLLHHVGLKPQIAKCDLCSLCGAGMDDICHICFECKAIALAAKLLPHWTLGEVDVIAIGTAKKSHQFLNKFLRVFWTKISI